MFLTSSIRFAVAAFRPVGIRTHKAVTISTTRRFLSDDDSKGIQTDEYGRVIRSSSSSRSGGGGGGWDDFEPDVPSSSSRSSRNTGGGGWDDFDPFDDSNNSSSNKPRRSSPSRRSNNDGGRWRDGPPPPRQRRSFDDRRDNDNFRRGGGRERKHNNDFNNRGGGNRFGNNNNKKRKDGDGKRPQRQINMNALEGAGFVHLYGLSSVLNALAANIREFTAIEDQLMDFATDDDGEEIPDEDLPERKPEAQFRPWLFVQDKESARGGGGGRRGSKAAAAEQVLALAEERGVPTAQVDKGVLNTLSGNRPHQGFVLRCGKLSFDNIARIPHPDEDSSAPSVWLVLDEVVDPQNLGALLRSSYFLGGGSLGVLVTAKNSAPPSAVVSASSAGALELANIHSTSNLPRTLNTARSDGFRIIGASVSVPSRGDGSDDAPPLYDLQELHVQSSEDPRPILLVLGSEGYGLRTLVAKACTEFVKVPGADGDMDSGIDDSDEDQDFPSQAGVDSLNVSVTGGILLWHLLRGAK